MFQLEQPERSAEKARALGELERRGWVPMRTAIGDAIAAGTLAGDADDLAHLLWATIHGLVTLHLAGKLRLGRALADLVAPAIDQLVAAARPVTVASGQPVAAARPVTVASNQPVAAARPPVATPVTVASDQPVAAARPTSRRRSR
jgi:hypothetical protein